MSQKKYALICEKSKIVTKETRNGL